MTTEFILYGIVAIWMIGGAIKVYREIRSRWAD